MDLSTITTSVFKAFFRRDFPYAPAEAEFCSSKDSYIFDEDISKAFDEAKIIFNQALFSDDTTIRIAYLYLTAHYLVNDIRAALAGIEGVGSNPLSSRSVGNVSESYTVSKEFADNPQLAFLNTTSYGAKYLSLLLPRLVGNVKTICGTTTP